VIVNPVSAIVDAQNRYEVKAFGAIKNFSQFGWVFKHEMIGVDTGNPVERHKRSAPFEPSVSLDMNAEPVDPTLFG
jgi:hypothetical protein